MYAPLLFAVFAPLASFLVVGCFSNKLSNRLAFILSITLMGLSALGGVSVFYASFIKGHFLYLKIAPFLSIGTTLWWDLAVDPLSGLMVGLVTFISFLVHFYSAGYMASDESAPRFMSYLSFLLFACLFLFFRQTCCSFLWAGKASDWFLICL